MSSEVKQVFTRNTPVEELPEIMTFDQVLQALGIGNTFFYKLKDAGLIQAINYNPMHVKPSKAFYSRDDVDRLRHYKRVVNRPKRANAKPLQFEIAS